MSLLNITNFKTEFPLWEKFVLDDNNITNEELLQLKLNQADAKLNQYIIVPEGTELPNWLRLHLYNIAAKFCFDVRHGDTEFEPKPQIIKEYEITIEALESFLDKNGMPQSLSKIQKAISESSNPDKIKMHSKKRMFGPEGGFAGYGETHV